MLAILAISLIPMHDMVGVPEIGCVLGIEIGRTHVEDFRRRFGHGKQLALPAKGPISEFWFDPRDGRLIEVDSDSWHKQGHVIDEVKVSFCENYLDGKPVPLLHPKSAFQKPVDQLRKGMKREAVERLLGSRLDSHDLLVQVGSVKFPLSLATPGQWRVSEFSRWRISCHFDAKGLKGFEVWAGSSN